MQASAHEENVMKLFSDRLEVQVAKPGTVYKGSRFDWTGFVTQVILDGRHTFCTVEDTREGFGTGGKGLCNEFGIFEAIGYEETMQGERFPKIGTGLLLRPDESEYVFHRPYELIPFETVSQSNKEEIVFCSNPKPCAGYSVSLVKRIKVCKNTLTIEYKLENCGSKRISTVEYCHNFLCLDNTPTGTDYILRMPYPVAADRELSVMSILADSLLWEEEIREPFYCRIKVPENCTQYFWELINTKLGIGVREENDFTPAIFALWGKNHVISPEAFVKIDLEPGQTQRWTRKYTFFQKH